MTAANISLLIFMICNLTISTGIFFQYFKKSLIIPVNKVGDKKQCNNYRHISLTLFICFIFKECLKKWLLLLLIIIIGFP